VPGPARAWRSTNADAAVGGFGGACGGAGGFGGLAGEDRGVGGLAPVVVSQVKRVPWR
jgi:hypothetical protein